MFDLEGGSADLRRNITDQPTLVKAKNVILTASDNQVKTPQPLPIPARNGLIIFLKNHVLGSVVASLIVLGLTAALYYFLPQLKKLLT